MERPKKPLKTTRHEPLRLGAKILIQPKDSNSRIQIPYTYSEAARFVCSLIGNEKDEKDLSLFHKKGANPLPKLVKAFCLLNSKLDQKHYSDLLQYMKAELWLFSIRKKMEKFRHLGKQIPNHVRYKYRQRRKVAGLRQSALDRAVNTLSPAALKAFSSSFLHSGFLQKKRL